MYCLYHHLFGVSLSDTQYIHLYIKNLSLDATFALANAYCNSLLYSVPAINFDKSQCVQNSLKIPRITPSKPLLIKLHWIPIYSRINPRIFTALFEAVIPEKRTLKIIFIYLFTILYKKWKQ